MIKKEYAVLIIITLILTMSCEKTSGLGQSFSNANQVSGTQEFRDAPADLLPNKETQVEVCILQKQTETSFTDSTKSFDHDDALAECRNQVERDSNDKIISDQNIEENRIKTNNVDNTVLNEVTNVLKKEEEPSPAKINLITKLLLRFRKDDNNMGIMYGEPYILSNNQWYHAIRIIDPAYSSTHLESSKYFISGLDPAGLEVPVEYNSQEGRWYRVSAEKDNEGRWKIVRP